MTIIAEKEKLLPCPFCGSDGVRLYKKNIHFDIVVNYHVQCDHCGNQTDYFDNASEARAAWNRRAEQIAVKVIRETEDENGVPLEHENYLCPGCKTLIYQHYKKCKWIEPIRWQNYCIDCGQRMDWSDFINPPLPGEEGT